MFPCPRCRRLFQNLVLATACICAVVHGDPSHLETMPAKPQYEQRIHVAGSSAASSLGSSEAIIRGSDGAPLFTFRITRGSG
jgi:hypothetical protein